MKTNILIVKKLTTALEKKCPCGTSTSTGGVFMGDVNRTLLIAVAGSNR
jgi:hypothetical protein